MIKCFPVSNIAVIYYKQAVEFYTNWSGCYQLLWHFILILKINLETGKKVQNYCSKQPVRAYLQSGRGSIVFRETAHSTGIKVSGGEATAAESQFPTWVLAPHTAQCRALPAQGPVLFPFFLAHLRTFPHTCKHQLPSISSLEFLLKQTAIMVLRVILKVWKHFSF